MMHSKNLTPSEFIHYLELGLIDSGICNIDTDRYIKQLHKGYQEVLDQIEHRHRFEISDLEYEISCLKCEIENLEQDLCSECSGRKR